MNYKITPPAHRSRLAFDLPLSKSMSNRALLISALTKGGIDDSIRFADCDDTKAMKSGLLKEAEGGHVNVGAAGTAMRFLTAFFASRPGVEVVLDGSERMRKRPIGLLVDALKSIGADITYEMEDGFPPLRIKGGELRGGVVKIPGSVSSQYISALMMIGTTMTDGLTIKLEGKIISLPYILMTAVMMMRAGVNVMFHDRKIEIGHCDYSPVAWTIEGDWSGASYWYELTASGATNGVRLGNLRQESIQGDSAVARYFDQLGVDTSFIEENGESVALLSHTNKLVDSLDIDLTGQPDIAQTIAVTSFLLGVPFNISGLSTLPSKETDRLQALRSELRRLGCNIKVINNEIITWDGKKCTPDVNPRIRTYDDHRMAMAFAPAAVNFPGLIIENVEVVSKSYPEFWNNLAGAGFKLEVVK
ncbi:MAG: 3-phosphoshikimate 1-carboxyvinyltransferase [Muribaculaceae bacterium]|nr:3-phosphoshikimate 1-carboxyvinyltransferase [Muribaculaceae bacterium]MDE7369704.1 3-phosphoshikimate 1-carboxyvinyltransferase [Muribaculaceae bacterium]